MLIHSPTLAALAVAALVLSQAQTPPPQAEPAARTAITLDAIQVAPAGPASSPLCRLSVRLVNHGERTASRFKFTVTINGRTVDAYTRTRFLNTIAPGQSVDLRLYNFWAAEPPQRPTAPTNVEVTLTAAEWVTREDAPGGIATWIPQGAVAGLPPLKRLVIPAQDIGK